MFKKLMGPRILINMNGNQSPSMPYNPMMMGMKQPSNNVYFYWGNRPRNFRYTPNNYDGTEQYFDAGFGQPNHNYNGGNMGTNQPMDGNPGFMGGGNSMGSGYDSMGPDDGFTDSSTSGFMGSGSDSFMGSGSDSFTGSGDFDANGESVSTPTGGPTNFETAGTTVPPTVEPTVPPSILA